MEENLLIVHGGGPTAVMNASLHAAVTEARKNKEIRHVYGARNGTGGLLRNEFINLEEIPEERLKLLLKTPGSAIGTSRDALEDAQYGLMVEILKKNNIRFVLFNGGNGTMDACGKLHRAVLECRAGISVIGIPKTMDNDLAVTDHSPGYGSAALYMAQSVREVCADVKGLPIHVVVIEASGRNAGWIAAASSLASEFGGPGPDLIYLPEWDFDEEKFIADVKKLLETKSGIVVVASEGLHGPDGRPIVKPVYETGRATYFGDVSSHLAGLVTEKLGCKARGEKPGLLGRASVSLQSPVDREEAELAGRLACQAVMRGESGKMVAFQRVSSDPYEIRPFLTDLDKVMLHEKKMPPEFMNEDACGVTEAFRNWCRPLIGKKLDEMISFN